MAWFSGYCDADGSISRNGTNQSLQVSSINKDFLINIKLMLQTCGLNSIVRLNMCERRSELPKMMVRANIENMIVKIYGDY